MTIPREYEYPREIPGQGICAITHFLYTVGLVVNIGKFNYDRRYCFHTRAEALAALKTWDGSDEHPPGNWIKCKGSCHNFTNPSYKEHATGN